MIIWKASLVVVVVFFAAAGLALLPIVTPLTKHPTRRLVASQCAPKELPDYVHLDHIDRVLVISDLHVDHAENMQWLTNRTHPSAFSSTASSTQDTQIILTHSDLLVVAGDISHEHDRIEHSLQCLVQTGASVLFVVGNHEAWLSSSTKQKQHKGEGPNHRSSMEKLDAIHETCQRLGVYSQTCLKVGGTVKRPHTLWLVPMESWYDGSLSLTECEDLCHDFGSWPWVDFIKCQWSSAGFGEMQAPNQRIPQGLSQYFATLNEPLLQVLPQWISDQTRNDDDERTTTLTTVETGSTTAVMTISHFLPNQQCLPDWKDIHSPTFQRSSWLEHGGGGVSAKFAKVAGTCLLDQQIRSLQLPTHVRQMHVFGHSHRPKDFEFQGIRYIHNPLGKPREREIYMVSPNADFQEVWNTKDKGEVLGNQVIRFWEEQGGGLEALKIRMDNSKRTNRYGKYSKKGIEPQGNATKVAAG